MSTAVIEVPSEIIQKWQEIADLVAEIVHVPAALVMRVEPPNIKVLISSKSNGNPYHRDELAPLNTGLYCETVMKTRHPLLVPDALLDDEWKSNPDIKLGMISYLGFPVAWPNGQMFGTICVLDSRGNAYSELYHKFVLQCRDVLQADLRSLAKLSGELTRSEAYLVEAQKLSHTGSFGWRISTGEIIWSEETYRIFQYDRPTKPTIELFLQRVHPEDAALVQQTIERGSQDGKDFAFESRLLMPDSCVKHVHVVAHVLSDEAGSMEFVGAVMDVTERRRAEEERKLAEDASHRAQAHLARVARITTMGELATSIAHEVNQPLTGILANGNACLRWLTREFPDLDEARDAVRRVINDGSRAGEIISRIRALSKKAGAEMEPLEINKVVREIITLAQGEIRRNRVALRTELADGLPPVLGDRVQLQQVLLNLIINGIDAMKPVEDRPLELLIRTQKADDGQVCVAVQDSGVGLDQKHLDQIFDAFFTTKPEGIGMGLSISRSIVQNHGGRLWAAVNEGPGATFQFTLAKC